MPTKHISRSNRIKEIQKSLGKRKLIWFGTRGSDASPLLEIANFAETFSIISPLGNSSVKEFCLESESGTRVDLDSYRLEYDKSDAVRKLEDRLYKSMSEACAVAVYRPNNFFYSIYYPQIENAEYLGLFHERQAPFENKPWVETELKKIGVKVIPWRYFRDGDPKLVEVLSATLPAVLRANRSDGGAGLALITDMNQLDRSIPMHTDGFIGVAPFLTPSIPLNVNVCIFRNGEITLHSPSAQLIGIPGLTSRRFGYCGNDFALPGELGKQVVDKFEKMIRAVARWMAEAGYIGVFGIDALLYDGEVYLSEVNPRFQGSSALSASIDKELGRSDMFLEHLAAFLALAPSSSNSLWELADNQLKVSQVVCHNCSGSTVRAMSMLENRIPRVTPTLVPQAGLFVESEAILFKAILNDQVTSDGYSLKQIYADQLTKSIKELEGLTWENQGGMHDHTPFRVETPKDSRSN